MNILLDDINKEMGICYNIYTEFINSFKFGKRLENINGYLYEIHDYPMSHHVDENIFSLYSDNWMRNDPKWVV